jgi:hypothetical protein
MTAAPSGVVTFLFTDVEGSTRRWADSTASLLSGVDLVDLGPRRLRDLPTPVGVFQVRAAGLRTDFPPLRALNERPGNLRPQTTSFIGREIEVADLKAALHQHRLHPLLTGIKYEEFPLLVGSPLANGLACN